MDYNWQELINEAFSRGTVPTVEKIYAVHKIAKDFIEEQYLHHMQDEHHIQHTKFSPELLEKLNSVWLQQLDKQTGSLPITVLKNKLDKILGAETIASTKEVKVTMVPVSGLFYIYSGELGDACYADQHIEMARGDFPDIRAWIYVTNRGKPNEELKGTAFGVQTETPDESPTLLVRANNPSENFIQGVDSDAFVLSTLKEAVETAKRIRQNRIENDQNLSKTKLAQKVVIPMDDRGQSSTNRQPVNNSYRKRFINCKKTDLENTPDTNFNDYNVWNSKGSHPCVVIWEMDEEGNEIWHGNWNK